MGKSFRDTSALILNEIRTCLFRIDEAQIEALVNALQRARRILLVGAGRMGLVLSSFCMRLGHLGLDAHMVGTVTCPPIGEGDLLLVASSSGETPTVREVVRKASAAGAEIATITATPDSTIAELATLVLDLEAPASLEEDDRDSNLSVLTSRQPMKTLFEQSLFLLLESLVLQLMERTGQDAGDLAKRHANLE